MAGQPGWFDLDERVTRHSIRHTMAREVRRRRVPLEQRQVFLGHLPRGSAHHRHPMHRTSPSP